MKLLIDIECKKLVKSFSSSSSDTLPAVIIGDAETIEIHILQKDGSDNPENYYSERVFQSGEGLRVGLGIFQPTKQLLAISTGFTLLESGQGASVLWDLKTTNLAEALDSKKSLEAFFEVELTSGENIYTILQIPVTVKNEVIEGNVPNITLLPTFEEFKTACETAKDDSIQAKNDTITAKNDAQASATLATQKAEEASNHNASALSASSQAESYKNQTAEIKSQTETLKSETLQIKSSAISEIDALKDDCETAKSDAQTAKADAIQAKNEAIAFVDTDGLLQQAQSDINELQTLKSGEHLFASNSYLKILDSGILNTNVFTLCFFTDFDFQTVQSTDVWYPFNVGPFSGPSDIENRIYAKVGSGDYFRIVPYTSKSNAFALSNIRAHTNQKWNAICIVIYNNDVPKLFVNGNAMSAQTERASEGWVTSISNLYLNASYDIQNTSSAVSYRNFKIFNFDLSDENAPYKVTDYQLGKSIPLSLGKAFSANSKSPNLSLTPANYSTISTASFVENKGLASELVTPILSTRSWSMAMFNLPFQLKLGDKIEFYANARSFILDEATEEIANNFCTKVIVMNGTAGVQYLNSTSSVSNGEKITAEISPTGAGYSRLGIQYIFATGATSRTDYFDFEVKINGLLLELSDKRDAYQIRDTSGKGKHSTIFGDVVSRKNKDVSTMQVSYTWGDGVSTGAYVMGDTVTIPANSEVEILAQSSASATLSMGTSSSATTSFANAVAVGVTPVSACKFYTGNTAQKLFVTPSAAGLGISLIIKSVTLK